MTERVSCEVALSHSVKQVKGIFDWPVVFSPDSSKFAITRSTSAVTVHSTSSPEEYIAITPAELGAEFDYADVEFDPSGHRLAIAAGCVEQCKSFVACFDIRLRKVVAFHQINDERLRQVVFKDNLLVFQDPDEDLASIDLSTGRISKLFQMSWHIDEVTPWHFRSGRNIYRYTSDGDLTHVFVLNSKIDDFHADSCSLLGDARLLLFGTYGNVRSRPVEKYWVVECRHGDWKEVDTVEFDEPTYPGTPSPCWYTRHAFYLKQRELVISKPTGFDRINLSSIFAPDERCMSLSANPDMDRFAFVMRDRVLLVSVQ